MENINWLKQTQTEPLFPDLLWNRPENRRHAGKLLIIGGNSTSFSAVSSAYAASQKAGIGTVRVILPDSLEKMLSRTFPEADFAPSTPSGSFARTALGPICDVAAWTDSTLLAGELSKNSETAILLESFLSKYKDSLSLAGDSLDYFYDNPAHILDRQNTSLVARLSQLQKLLSGRLLVKHTMNLIQIVEALSKFSANCSAAIITLHSDHIIVAADGRVSTIPSKKVDMVALAAYVSVWRLQQPAQPFEALTCAVYCSLQK